MGMDRLAPRFPHCWLKISASPGYAPMIGCAQWQGHQKIHDHIFIEILHRIKNQPQRYTESLPRITEALDSGSMVGCLGLNVSSTFDTTATTTDHKHLYTTSTQVYNISPFTINVLSFHPEGNTDPSQRFTYHISSRFCGEISLLERRTEHQCEDLKYAAVQNHRR